MRLTARTCLWIVCCTSPLQAESTDTFTGVPVPTFSENATVSEELPLSDGSSDLDAEYDALYKALLDDPTNPEKSFKFAEMAVKRGDLRGAIAALTRVLQIKPNLPNIQLELGILYLRAGSPDLAKTYINQALQSPNIPVWVINRARVLLAQAERDATRHFVTGRLYFGGRYDSNANAAPDSRLVRVRGQDGLLNENATGRSDWSAELVAGLQYVYALDSQHGNQIEVDFLSYNRRYNESDEINTNSLDLDVGPRYFFGEVFDPDFSIRPYLSGTYVLLADDQYLRALGGGLNVRSLFNIFLLGELTFEVEDQKFFDSDLRPAASDRSGTFYRVNGRLAWQARPSTILRFGADLSRRDSQQGFESFNGYAIRLSATETYSPPFNWTQQPWSTALLGSFRNTKYDEPDPLIDPLVKRDEDRWDVVLSTTVPLSRQFALNAAINYTDNSATLPNYEFDNLGGSLGIAWTF